MRRRDVLKASAGLAVLPLAAGIGWGAGAHAKRRVAFLLGPNANVIDTAGPWEVFQDTFDGDHPIFELFTVAPTLEAQRMTGGLVVMPHYDFNNAPAFDVLVVPAHRGSTQSLSWLRKAAANAEIILSVCTGAFQLGRAGLLDGREAATHHDSWDAFEAEFPKVRLIRGPRFVDSGNIVTAGGLTSGIDAALHVVKRLVGADAAARTAENMEYSPAAPLRT